MPGLVALIRAHPNGGFITSPLHRLLLLFSSVITQMQTRTSLYRDTLLIKVAPCICCCWLSQAVFLEHCLAVCFEPTPTTRPPNHPYLGWCFRPTSLRPIYCYCRSANLPPVTAVSDVHGRFLHRHKYRHSPHDYALLLIHLQLEPRPIIAGSGRVEGGDRSECCSFGRHLHTDEDLGWTRTKA